MNLAPVAGQMHPTRRSLGGGRGVMFRLAPEVGGADCSTFYLNGCGTVFRLKKVRASAP